LWLLFFDVLSSELLQELRGNPPKTVPLDVIRISRLSFV